MNARRHYRDDALRTRGQVLAAEREWACAPQRLTVHNTLRTRQWPARTMLAIYALATLANIAHAARWI